MSWELEKSAEELRQGNPAAWARYLEALSLELKTTIEHLIDSRVQEETLTFQGEARMLRRLVNKLQRSREVSNKLKERG